MRSQDGITFDETGAPCQIVDFDWRAVEGEPECQDVAKARQETLSRLLAFLVNGDASPQRVGRRALLLNQLVARHGTQRALAKRLGVSAPRVTQLLTATRSVLEQICHD